MIYNVTISKNFIFYCSFIMYNSYFELAIFLYRMLLLVITLSQFIIIFPVLVFSISSQ